LVDEAARVRRQDIKNPSLSNHELERLLGKLKHLEFHFWYLRKRQEIQEDGMLAVAVEGFDWGQRQGSP